MHTDSADARRARTRSSPSAQARGVPVVSARADARLARRPQRLVVRRLAWNGDDAALHGPAGAGANGLQAMVPAEPARARCGRSRAAGSPVAIHDPDDQGHRVRDLRCGRRRYVATYAAAVATAADDSAADFGGGDAGADTFVGASGAGADGEVQLRPTVGEEFGGAALSGAGSPPRGRPAGARRSAAAAWSSTAPVRAPMRRTRPGARSSSPRRSGRPRSSTSAS